MIWEKYKSKFHYSWHRHVQKFIESEKCDEIFAYLKQRKEEGAEIAPSSFNLFKAFRETSFDELKCVIIGENPYNKFVEDIPIDTGVLFGASTIMQPNLHEFYNGLEKEYYDGININVIYDYDLTYLTSQGILMLSSSLTIERDSEKGHNKIWEPFIKFLLEDIISYTGVPIIFLGRSKKYISLVEQSNECYSLELPKFGNMWETQGTFKKIDKWIEDNNLNYVNWLQVDLPF